MIRFVVALQSEASPLIERLRLEPVSEGPFRVFRGEDGVLGEVWLILSGLGKAAAAAATAYLHLLSGGRPDRAWLNVGVGGHCEASVGQAFVAHKVSDAASGLSWYPQLVIDSPRPTAPVLTLESVEDEYALPWVYEMEAAGFVPTACRFATAELVHCFKVISDTPDTTLSRRMPAAYVLGLIGDNVEGIVEFARGLAGLACEVEALATDPHGYAQALERWPFPASERPRLRRLLRRLAALAPPESRANLQNDLWGDLSLPALARPLDVIRALETRLASIPVRLPEPMDVVTS
jgi:adenosylhomocysteine nucleosidase